MPVKSIDIIVRHDSHLCSTITTEDAEYTVYTKTNSNNSAKASSRVHLNRKVLYSEEASFSHLIGSCDIDQKLNNFLTQLHKSVITHFSSILEKKNKRKSEYLLEVRSLITQNRHREALLLLKDGLSVYKNEPLLLSYYGMLCARVEKNHRKGIMLCRDSISKLQALPSVDHEFMYPLFYLNLGRAYLEANRRREAFRAFDIGLNHDPRNADITAEIRQSGRRRKTLFPFLKRTNPLNKYLGILHSKIMTS